ncbi:MAG TPA: acyltransferase [Geminicoccus sp.]|jgi:peptidoglycan/LPS O-acetylase OafA/YrhL|uniref:acyltransferase family protein n=1 Tax=Geminicoccus sp. TaxID=2024832 RepID=UPI002E34CA5C|nr:acyltransferase [Geminicoccus sp.]HEX2526158.1 acyltransferase [Geminicoccus sp.]
MRTIREAYQRWHRTDNPSYLPGLDGVRALSVSLVIVAHAGFGNIVPGGLGVTVFFFVSGFLITNLLVSEHAKKGRNDIWSFYVRRYLRLSPELYLYILVCALLSLVFLHNVPWLDVLAGLLYFTNYLHIFHHVATDTPFTLGHLWSLAVEEHFYLTYPLLLAATVAWPRRLLAILVGICVFSLTVRLLGLHLLNAENYSYYASEARLDSIAYGCICALLTRVFFRRIDTLASYARTTFIAGALMMLASLLVRDQVFRETLRYSMQGLALLLCFISLYGSSFGAYLIRILELPPLRFIGQVSYGIYLWHFMPIQIYANLRGHELPETMGAMDKLLALVVAFAFATAVAYPSFRYVLGAVAALRRRFGSHGLPSGGGAQAEVATGSVAPLWQPSPAAQEAGKHG